jgi:hypothetical protein
LRRIIPFLTALVTLVSFGSCSMPVGHTVPRSDVTAASPKHVGKFTRFSTPKGQRVSGYTTTDGRFHTLRGWAHVVGDTAVFQRPEGRTAGWPPEREPAITERVAVSDLESVRSEAIGLFPTALFVTMAVATMAAAFGAGFAGGWGR